MTRTPEGPEFDATRALGDAFRQAGRERQATMDADLRRQRKRRRWTAFGSSGLVILVVGGTTAVATKLFDGDGGTVGVDRGGLAEQQRAPADRRLAAARTADPRDAEPWGLRLYTGVRGYPCVVVGRIVRGRLGVLQDGRFSALPSDAPGACADPSSSSGVHVTATVRTYGSATGARTVLYGVTDRTIQAMAYGRRGRFTTIPIANDGTFVVALAGVGVLRGQQLRIRGAAGTTVRSLPGTG